MTVPLIAVLLSALVVPAQATFNVDEEGFIRNWLVLAPIAIEGESGAAEIDKALINGEAAVKPKANDRAIAGVRELTWTAIETGDFFIDFLESFGGQGSEYVAGYAVAYVIADQEMTVTLSAGTNDQGKAWLNGKEVFKFAEARTLEKDASRHAVTLLKGTNVLVLKVINEVNNWQGCVRFLRGETPVTNLKISLAPQ